MAGLLPPATIAAVRQRAAAVGVGADRVLPVAGHLSEEVYLKALGASLGVAFEPLDDAARPRCPVDDDAPDRKRIDGVVAACRRRRADGGGGAARVRGAPADRLAAGQAGIGATLPLHDRRAAQPLRAAPCRRGHRRARHRPAQGDLPGPVRRPTRRAHDVGPARAPRPRGDRRQHRRAGPGAGRDPGGAVPVLARLALCRCLHPAPSPPPPAIADDALPIYSVIAALYREAASIDGLLHAIERLDYPPEKLDVIIALEADDRDTRAAIATRCNRIPISVITVPEGGPRTKPKALNAALPFARGSFTVIYDAEDRPEPDQLRRALQAFDDRRQ